MKVKINAGIATLENLRGLSFVAFVFSLTCFSSLGHAQYLPGPVATALGGAGLAASDEGEQILLNPAAVIHASPASSSLFYEDGYLAEDEHDRVLGLSLLDNSEGLIFSGGYSYINRKRTFSSLLSRDEQYHQISLGRFVRRHFSAGASITYLETDLRGGEKHRQWDGHLGLLYNPDPDLGIGLVFYNIFSRDKDVPVDVQNLDRVAVGVHYILMPLFRARLDIAHQLVYNPENHFSVHMGIESHLGEFFVTRLGLEKDRLAERDYISAGIGFNGPRLKADYFYRKNTDYSGGAMHGVDLRLPFW